MMAKNILFAGLFLFCISGRAPAQPEPWAHPDGSIHYYCAVDAPDGIDWAAASDSAARLGGYLATITSRPENDFVFNLVFLRPYWYRRAGSGWWAGPWLGGRQRVGAPEPDSGWEWVTGEPFDYTNWSQGQPNNVGDQDAINFGESPYCWLPTWNDISSLDPAIHGYVVELSADSTTVGLLQSDTNACPGYTLFESSRSPVTYLIDNEGRYVHSWRSQYTPALTDYLLEDGNLLHTATVGNTHFTGGWAGGRVELLDWNDSLLWAYDYSNDFHCQHHDVEWLPNGHVLILAWEAKTRAEAIASGRDTCKLWSNELWPDHIIEVNPANDSIVWQWHTWDHLVQDFDSTKANYGVVADHSELVDINFTPTGTAYADWMHSNAVRYNPQFDQILIDVRDLGEMWVIDHSTTAEQARGHTGGHYGMGGDLLYRWGNPQAYRAGWSWDRKLFGQHDARWIEPGLMGAGHILVFNNGVGRLGYDDYSTVDEFIPACDTDGSYPRPKPGVAFGPSGLWWRYTGSSPKRFFSKYMSGARRLPNGNTLICEADSGFFFEVPPDGRTVWRYVNPVIDTTRLSQGDTVPKGTWSRQNATFRATHYAPDYTGLLGHDLTPGLPLEHYERPTLSLAETPSPLGLVRQKFSVHPNPARAGTAVSLQLTAYSPTQVSVFDASGRLVRSLLQSRISNLESKMVWDGRDASGRLCPPGVYVCRLTAPGTTATTKILLTE